VALAERVAASPVLRLAGVAGYEGAVAHARSAEDEAAVVAYPQQMLALHRRVAGLYDGREVMVTAGGSVDCDLVAEVAGAAQRESPDTAWVLRAGAYRIDGHGHHAGRSPRGGPPDDLSDGEPPADGVRPGVLAVAQAVSRPEPHLAYLDAGKRELAQD